MAKRKSTEKRWYTVDKNVPDWMPDGKFIKAASELGIQGHIDRSLDQYSVMISCTDQQKADLMGRLGSDYTLTYVPRRRAKVYFFIVGMAHHDIVKAFRGLIGA